MGKPERIRLTDVTISPGQMLSAASSASQYVQLRMRFTLYAHGRSLRSMSATTAAVRFSTLSFRRIRSTCFSIVRALTRQMTLISQFVLPFASHAAISASRGVRSAPMRGRREVRGLRAFLPKARPSILRYGIRTTGPETPEPWCCPILRAPCLPDRA